MATMERIEKMRVSDDALDLVFRKARTYNAWLPRPVPVSNSLEAEKQASFPSPFVPVDNPTSRAACREWVPNAWLRKKFQTRRRDTTTATASTLLHNRTKDTLDCDKAGYPG